jgi:thioredoxin 1
VSQLRWAAAALGLVLAACAGAAHAPARELQLAPAGVMVDVEAATVEDHVTIVDFWATWCAACHRLDAALRAALVDQPGVVIRRVDIGEPDSEVARAYQIGALPHLRLYDRSRRLRYVLVGADTDDAAALAIELTRTR